MRAARRGDWRMTVLARGLSRLSPAAGTYIRFGTGDISQKVPEFASEEGPGPGLAPRESVWSVSRKFSRIRFQFGRHKRTRKRASEGRNAEERKSPGGGIRLGIRNRAEACGGVTAAWGLPQEDRKDMAAGKKRKEAGAATVESRRKRRLAHFPNSFGLRFGDWHDVRLRIR